MKIFENKILFIEVEKSEIPWLKIFPLKKYKELSDCDTKTRVALLDAMLLIETEMIKYYSPKKVNIAMFGNYLPHLHIHVMARFENDSYFPEPVWGNKQRNGDLNLPSFENFISIIKKNFKKYKIM